MFHTLNIVYWIVLIGIICIITYVILWKYFHKTINRKILSSTLTGALSGAIIFFLIQKQPEGAPLLTIYFIEILFLTTMAAGVLAVLLGGNILKTSHDLSIMGLVIGLTFSFLSISGVVYKEILQGKFLTLTSSYVLDKAPLFVFFFLVSFFASLGAGSLFIQYVLQEAIDGEIS